MVISVAVGEDNSPEVAGIESENVKIVNGRVASQSGVIKEALTPRPALDGEGEGVPVFGTKLFALQRLPAQRWTCAELRRAIKNVD